MKIAHIVLALIAGLLFAVGVVEILVGRGDVEVGLLKVFAAVILAGFAQGLSDLRTLAEKAEKDITPPQKPA